MTVPLQETATKTALASHSQNPRNRHDSVTMDRLVRKPNQIDLESAVDLATDLVTNELSETRKGGLDLLVSLSDPSQSGSETASYIALNLFANDRLSSLLWSFARSEVDDIYSLGALRMWVHIWHVLVSKVNTIAADYSGRIPNDTGVQHLLQHVANVEN